MAVVITAAMVKKLREATNAGMSSCKKALVEADGDFDRAVEILRENGLAAAAKKAGRIASEGVVQAFITDDNAIGVLVEVNSETDFAAKAPLFRNYVSQVVAQVVQSKSTDIEGLLAEKWNADETETVKDALLEQTSKIGEHLDIRRFERYEKQGTGVLVSYVHGGGKVAVLLELSCDKSSDMLAEAGKNVCMQIAAMSPKFVGRSDVSDDFMQKERDILTQQAKLEEKEAADKNPNYRAKPEKVMQNIITGRLNKELKEFCLLEQEYVRESDQTVGQYLEAVGKQIGSPITVKRFVRYETGEGIEKKTENFAEEVSKAMGQS
jgi:elongation factor Ts